MSHPKKSVLVTGCSAHSLGDAIATEFHRRGFRVFATARSANKITHLKALGIETLLLDVTSVQSIRTAVQIVSSRTNGTLDILFNNAGRAYTMPLSDVDLDAMRATFEVNVFSIVAMTQAFLPLLLASKGTVLNHGSMSSLLMPPMTGAYTASKAAVAALSDTMRIELAPFGVHVVHLITGLCKSNMFNPDGDPKLPPTSLYLPVKEEMEAVMRIPEDLRARATDPHVFAKRLVSDLVDVKNPPKWLYEGAMSLVAWFLSTFLWTGALDGLQIKYGGFGTLSGKLKTN